MKLCGVRPLAVARKSVLMPIRGRSFMAGFLSLRWRQRNPFVDRPEVCRES
jgi:hypothetical protein